MKENEKVWQLQQRGQKFNKDKEKNNIIVIK